MKTALKLFIAGFTSLALLTAAVAGEPPPPSEVFRENVNIEAGRNVVGSGTKVREVPLSKVPSSALPKAPVVAAYFGGNDRSPGVAAVLHLKNGANEGRSGNGAVSRRSGTPAGAASRRGEEAAAAFLKGYCWFERDVEVSVETWEEVPCLLEGAGGSEFRGWLRVKLVPNYSRASLGLQPKLLIGADGSRYDVVKWYSPVGNVADEVDRRLWRRALAAGFVAGSEQARKGYEEYARSKQEKVYYTESGDVVKEREVPASYPLVSALITGVSKAFSSLVEGFRSKFQNNPYLYRIHAGKPVYVELTVRPQKLPGSAVPFTP